VDAAKPPRSAAAPRDPRGQLPRPRVRAAQTQRKLSEELGEIAGDVVLDLGTRNSFGASLSSTILGSEERDVSRGLLRSLARSRRSSGHNTPAVHTDAEDERVSRGEGSLMLAAGSTAGDPQTPQPRRGAPPVPDLSRTPRREGQADADRDGRKSAHGQDLDKTEHFERQTVMRALNATLLSHRLRHVAGEDGWDRSLASDKSHCQNLYWYLWAPHPDTGRSFDLCRIPSTLVVRQGMPAAWFYSTPSGEVRKKDAESYASRGSILQGFRQGRAQRRVGESDVHTVAHFIPRSFSGAGLDMVQLDQTNLELFLLQGELRDGVLQQHVRGADDTTYLVEVEWRPTMFRVLRSKIRGLPRAAHRAGCKIGALDPSMREASQRSADLVLRTGMSRRLRQVTSALVKHLHAVSPQQYWVNSMVLHFALDQNGQLWLLYCSSLACEVPMESERRADTRRAVALAKPPGIIPMPAHLANPTLRRREAAPARRPRRDPHAAAPDAPPPAFSSPRATRPGVPASPRTPEAARSARRSAPPPLDPDGYYGVRPVYKTQKSVRWSQIQDAGASPDPRPAVHAEASGEASERSAVPPRPTRRSKQVSWVGGEMEGNRPAPPFVGGEMEGNRPAPPFVGAGAAFPPATPSFSLSTTAPLLPLGGASSASSSLPSSPALSPPSDSSGADSSADSSSDSSSDSSRTASFLRPPRLAAGLGFRATPSSSMVAASSS